MEAVRYLCDDGQPTGKERVPVERVGLNDVIRLGRRNGGRWHRITNIDPPTPDQLHFTCAEGLPFAVSRGSYVARKT